MEKYVCCRQWKVIKTLAQCRMFRQPSPIRLHVSTAELERTGGNSSSGDKMTQQVLAIFHIKLPPFCSGLHPLWFSAAIS